MTRTMSTTLAVLGSLAAAALAPPMAWAKPSGGTGGAIPPASGFPCAGCSLQLPTGYDPAKPAPLLVALHGSGNTSNKFWAAAKAAGYIELAPACPAADGCTKLDWNWPNGTVDWVFKQIDAVAARYNVELSRVYLVGQSAGAFFIGRNAGRFAGRVAGIGLVSGAATPGAACPDCKFPVYVLYGDQDTIARSAPGAGDYYERCGHEVVVDALAGYDHLGPIYALSGKEQKAAAILKFFDANRPTGCPANAPAAGGDALVTPPGGAGGRDGGPTGAGGRDGGAATGGAGGTPSGAGGGAPATGGTSSETGGGTAGPGAGPGGGGSTGGPGGGAPPEAGGCRYGASRAPDALPGWLAFGAAIAAGALVRRRRRPR